MKAWKDLELDGLRWVDVGGYRYELRGPDDDVIATMKRPSWWRSVIEVDAPGNRWRFERRGWWRQHITIQTAVTGDEPARFEYRGMSGGRLVFGDGRVYEWRQNNFWGTKWAWVTADGAPLLGFQSGGILRLNAEVSGAPAASDLPSLALLVFLGWYLLTLYHEDEGVSAAVFT